MISHKELLYIIDELLKHRTWFSEGPYGSAPDTSKEFLSKVLKVREELTQIVALEHLR